MITKIQDYFDMELSYVEKLFLPLHIMIVLPYLIEKWYNEAIQK